MAYIVIDNKAMKASKRLQGFKDKGYFLQADTLAELAKKMGVPPKALEETAKRYSEFVKNGKDLDFGRQHNLTLDFSQPPYYAVKTQPIICRSLRKTEDFSQIFTQPEKLLMTDHLDRDRRQSDFIKVILRHKTSLENLTDS